MRCHLDNFTWDNIEQKMQSGVLLNAPWQRVRFTLLQVPSAHVLNFDIFHQLSKPGFTITDVIWLGQTWAVKGAVYARY
jgi:hypothetical protein